MTNKTLGLHTAFGFTGGQAIRLPDPMRTHDCSVFTALENRKTTRDISAIKLPPQTLSNLLWAAFGVNRKAGPFEALGRTAPSASNSQEMDIYVAMQEGAFRYEADFNRLAPVTSEDVREAGLTPRQSGIDAAAPVTLIYVADMAKLEYTRGYKEPGLKDPEVQKSYSYVATGAIAANVYLFAAAEGLAAWFHNCDRPLLTRKLLLGPQQRVLFAQSVGYPDEA
jgi:nitroreductase